jgi:hypothetical protein
MAECPSLFTSPLNSGVRFASLPVVKFLISTLFAMCAPCFADQHIAFKVGGVSVFDETIPLEQTLVRVLEFLDVQPDHQASGSDLQRKFGWNGKGTAEGQARKINRVVRSVVGADLLESDSHGGLRILDLPEPHLPPAKVYITNRGTINLEPAEVYVFEALHLAHVSYGSPFWVNSSQYRSLGMKRTALVEAIAGINRQFMQLFDQPLINDLEIEFSNDLSSYYRWKESEFHALAVPEMMSRVADIYSCGNLLQRPFYGGSLNWSLLSSSASYQ